MKTQLLTLAIVSLLAGLCGCSKDEATPDPKTPAAPQAPEGVNTNMPPPAPAPSATPAAPIK